MSTVPHQSIAATAHFVEAERILAALPLATKRSERDHQVRLALVNSVLAIAATMLGPAERQTAVEPAERTSPRAASTHREARPAPAIRARRSRMHVVLRSWPRGGHALPRLADDAPLSKGCGRLSWQVKALRQLGVLVDD